MCGPDSGFDATPDVVTDAEVHSLLTAIAGSERSRAGVRHLMRNEAVARFT